MKGWEIKEISSSSRGMYMWSTSDIPPKWKDMRGIAEIPKLYEITRIGRGKIKKTVCPSRLCSIKIGV